MADSTEKKVIEAADIERVLADFDRKKEPLTQFCNRTKELLEEILQAERIRFQLIQGRVKNREKLRDKYLDPKKNYKSLSDITDQVALRVITYYEDEVDRVAEVVKREFDIDVANSIDKRETEPDKFGYYALNYVCKYAEERTRHSEYKKFADIWCEIQVTAILRHAWAEIEHPWYDLKDAFPSQIKRRFARMAALLEIAESEFLTLRKMQEDYRRSVEVQVGAKVPDISIDTVSLRSFIQQDPVVVKLDKTIATILGVPLAQVELSPAFVDFRSRAAAFTGFTNLDQLRDALTNLQGAIVEYVKSCRTIWIIGREARLGQGVSILVLAIMLAAAKGEKEAAQPMSDLSQSIGFNIRVRAQVAFAQAIMAKYSPKN